MLRFMRAQLRPDGRMPLYGSNDGALLFPFEGSSYEDFRPSLEMAEALNPTAATLPVLTTFDAGGYYWLRSTGLEVLMRSHRYRTRPGHMDLHHLDVWSGDINVFGDAGTFSYRLNTEEKSRYEGARAHNTCAIDGLEHATKVSNFGWAEWPTSTVLEKGQHSITSRLDAYRSRIGATLIRKASLAGDVLEVVDTLAEAQTSHRVEQFWNTTLEATLVDSHTAVIRHGGRRFQLHSSGVLSKEVAAVSRFYNSTEPATRIVSSASLSAGGPGLVTVIQEITGRSP
jgi:hypothetical protein